MGFFDKLKEGLAKTKNAVFGQVNEVVKSFRKVDEDLLEELEDALVLCDIGAYTAADKKRPYAAKGGFAFWGGFFNDF